MELVAKLMAQQDEVLEQLDELNLRVEKMIADLVQAREKREGDNTHAEMEERLFEVPGEGTIPAKKAA